MEKEKAYYVLIKNKLVRVSRTVYNKWYKENAVKYILGPAWTGTYQIIRTWYQGEFDENINEHEIKPFYAISESTGYINTKDNNEKINNKKGTDENDLFSYFKTWKGIKKYFEDQIKFKDIHTHILKEGEEIEMIFPSLNNKTYLITIIDYEGNTLYSEKYNPFQTKEKYKFGLSDLRKGLYRIIISSKNRTFVKRITIK